MILFIVIFIAIILILLWVCKNFFLIVRGESMYPTYNDGDVLLMRPVITSLENPKDDGIYVYTPPTSLLSSSLDTKRQVIKRLLYYVTLIDNSGYKCHFEGDNKQHSYDSRDYGMVEWNKVKFKIVAKLPLNFGESDG